MSYKLKPIPDNVEPRSCKGTLASRTSCGSPAVFDWTGPLKTNSRPMCSACTIVSLHNEMWAMQDNLEEQIGDVNPSDRIDDLEAEVAALKQERKKLNNGRANPSEIECGDIRIYLDKNYPDERYRNPTLAGCVIVLLDRYDKALTAAQEQISRIRSVLGDEE